MKFLGSKTLETERLILRKTEEQDLKQLWTILLDKEVSLLYLVGKIHDNWDEEKDFQYKKLKHASDNDVFCWTVVLKETGECIGQVMSQEAGDNKAIRDVGWFIKKDCWHKGYAYESTKAMLEYMFNEVEIDMIDTCAAIENDASNALMNKHGFKKVEGKTKTVNYTFAGEKECYIYYLTKDMYKEKEATASNNLTRSKR